VHTDLTESDYSGSNFCEKGQVLLEGVGGGLGVLVEAEHGSDGLTLQETGGEGSSHSDKEITARF